MPWTRLAQTAAAGATQIVLEKAVTWNVGDKIVLATTGKRHSQAQNEVRIISAISSDKLTLTLTEALKYEHIGVSQTFANGPTVEYRGEVGLLTRNVVVRGSRDLQWADAIKACPAGFNTGKYILLHTTHSML